LNHHHCGEPTSTALPPARHRIHRWSATAGRYVFFCSFLDALHKSTRLLCTHPAARTCQSCGESQQRFSFSASVVITGRRGCHSLTKGSGSRASVPYGPPIRIKSISRRRLGGNASSRPCALTKGGLLAVSTAPPLAGRLGRRAEVLQCPRPPAPAVPLPAASCSKPARPSATSTALRTAHCPGQPRAKARTLLVGRKQKHTLC
jgi:hypothetical protein